MAKIVVIGAGITGCTIARECARLGHEIHLLERDNQIGGLAKTFQYNEFRFDIGPHRFFTIDPTIDGFIKQTLDNEYHLISRRSEVYFQRHYHDWPLKPAALLKLPLSFTLKSAYDLMMMGLHRNGEDVTSFPTYIRSQYGPSLYNAFFKDYTEKFFGIAAEEIHADWAKEGMKRVIIDERIAHHRLPDIIRLMISWNPKPLWFRYPPKGIGTFCDALVRECRALGVQVETAAAVKTLAVEDDRIVGVGYAGNNIEADHVVWTGAIDTCARLLGLSNKALEYASLLLFNIELAHKPGRSFQWCYFGQSDQCFSRVSIPGEFSPEMVPTGKHSLCVEVTCRVHDHSWRNPDLLIPDILEQLIEVDLLTDEKTVDRIHVERIANAYPVYHLDYDRDRSEVIENISGIKGLHLAGRTGLFWYNNMDDSIANALALIGKITKSDKRNVSFPRVVRYKGTSKNRYERPRCKAHGAQKSRHIM